MNPSRVNTDLSRNIERAQYHRVGDDVLLGMKHKEYKTSIAYAKGLFYFAVQFNLLGPVRRSFDIFITIWRDLPVMRRFIQCHAVDRYTRKNRIRQFFEDQAHRAFLYFIEKLIDNNHTDLLTGIYDTFCQMVDEKNRKRKVRIISAFPMNQLQLIRLQEIMEDILKLKINIRNEVDSGILGGFVCYTDSIRIDMSLKRDLDKLRSQILSAPCLGNKKI